VYPALSVAEALAGMDNIKIDYVGSIGGMEAGIVARESRLRYLGVPAAAMRGRSPIRMARNSLTLIRGVLAAYRLIRHEQPIAILGTGGYVCVPIFVAARMAGVPTVIYLPDVFPGLAVRFLAKVATAIAGSVPEAGRYLGRSAVESDSVAELGSSQVAHKYLQSKLVVVGYPVRSALFQLEPSVCKAAFGLSSELPVLLVYGGSRGARSINLAIRALLKPLLTIAQVIHVCGREGDAEGLREAAERLPAELRMRYRLFEYLEAERSAEDPPAHTRPSQSMTSAFGAADLVLCRSGASTLGELPAAGLPAVLVPYPYVHQDENADYLVQHGAARKVSDSTMLGDGPAEHGPLFRELQRMIVESSERAAMAQRSRSLARPGAARRLAELLLALAARRTTA
jgi:UDP-N-acetylglucosamine--N-acetylmuramyl-(pentapeptide) pyrophosphoryl-undecaprenol N-acetylglucosamine transferase